MIRSEVNESTDFHRDEVRRMMSDCACKLIRKTHCGQGTLWKELADLEVKYLDRAPWSRLGWAGQGRAGPRLWL